MPSTPPIPPPPRANIPSPRTPPVYEVVAHEYLFSPRDITNSSMSSRRPPIPHQPFPDLPALPLPNRLLFTDLSSWQISQNRPLSEFTSSETTTLFHNYTMACHDNADQKKTLARLQSEVQELREITDGLTSPELGLRTALEEAGEAVVNEHKARERYREQGRVVEKLQDEHGRRVLMWEGILLALVAVWVIASDFW